MSQPNVNPDTGIRYGVIPAAEASHLEGVIIDSGTDLRYVQFQKDVIDTLDRILKSVDKLSGSQLVAEMAAVPGILPSAESWSTVEAIYTVASSTLVHKSEALFQSLIRSGDIEYESMGEDTEIEYLDSSGNEFLLSTTRGVSHIFCKFTKVVVRANSLCSPCFPNAGDLSSGISEDEHGYLCYGIPTMYRDE